jgi:Rrf2 family protein
MIRNDTDYALRMLVTLAEQSVAGLSTSELATRSGVPHGFAQKILRRLKAAGFLSAKPGRHGGFALRKAAKDVSLMDVVRTIQGPLLLNRCTGNPDACARQRFCRINTKLQALQCQVNDFLSGTALSDLLDTHSGQSGRGADAQLGGAGRRRWRVEDGGPIGRTGDIARRSSVRQC